MYFWFIKFYSCFNQSVFHPLCSLCGFYPKVLVFCLAQVSLIISPSVFSVLLCLVSCVVSPCEVSFVSILITYLYLKSCFQAPIFVFVSLCLSLALVYCLSVTCSSQQSLCHSPLSFLSAVCVLSVEIPCIILSFQYPVSFPSLDV